MAQQHIAFECFVISQSVYITQSDIVHSPHVAVGVIKNCMYTETFIMVKILVELTVSSTCNMTQVEKIASENYKWIQWSRFIKRNWNRQFLHHRKKTKWLGSFRWLCLYSVPQNSCSRNTCTAHSLLRDQYSACGCAHLHKFARNSSVASQRMTKSYVWKVRPVSTFPEVYCVFEDISRRLHLDLLESCVSKIP